VLGLNMKFGYSSNCRHSSCQLSVQLVGIRNACPLSRTYASLSKY